MVSLQHIRQSNAVSAVSTLTQHQAPTESAQTEGTKVSLTSWLSDDASLNYPETVQQYLHQVENDPSISEQEKNALFFNLVLRPKSEARAGNNLAQQVINQQDKASWKSYLSSLQYLSTLNSHNDRANSELHNNLTKHYQTLSSKL